MFKKTSLLLTCSFAAVQASGIPGGFVYVKDIVGVSEHSRYLSEHNALGRKLNGFKTNRIVLTKRAAKALAKAQADFEKIGYQLVLYNGYCPQRAIDDMAKWVKDTSDQKNKKWFYPIVDKADLIDEGYISKQSEYSRGSTVDVTIIPLGVLKTLAANLLPMKEEVKTLTDGREIVYLNDRTLDMGTHFGFWDPASRRDSDLVSKEARDNRKILHDVMVKSGFRPHEKQWWAFTLKDEPYGDTYFDFVPGG